MVFKNPYLESTFVESDPQFEITLRPKALSEFLGQEGLKSRLQVSLEAAIQRGEPVGHILFSGPPGLGKTTLAGLIARSMGSDIVVISAPVMEKAGDLAGILTSLKRGDILFIDEIHRLGRAIEEYLYSAMEDFKLDIVIDSGPSSRSIQMTLQPFTLVAATTRTGLVSSPLRSRFLHHFRLDYYPEEILVGILIRTAKVLQLSLGEEAARAIAKRSRGTPRIANNLLRWVRDFSHVKREGDLSTKTVEEALSLVDIDERGLDEIDKKFLKTMIHHHRGGPVGIATLAASLGEEVATLEEVHEPYLMMQGFIRRTPRGREATDLAYLHLNVARE